MKIGIIEYDKKPKVELVKEYRVIVTTNEGRTLDGGTYSSLEQAQHAVELMGDTEK